MGALQSRRPRIQLSDDVLVIILNYVKHSGLTDSQFYKYRSVCRQWRKVIEHLSSPQLVTLRLMPKSSYYCCAEPSINVLLVEHGRYPGIML
uniref:F-box domain-containing protein n=1 Tax=Steinernema glaseri TaxID=37863 RepID=A0A1I7Y0A2_9BILA